MHFLCQKKVKSTFLCTLFAGSCSGSFDKEEKKKKTGKVKRRNEQSLFLPFSGNLLIEGHFGVRDVKQPALLNACAEDSVTSAKNAHVKARCCGCYFFFGVFLSVQQAFNWDTFYISCSCTRLFHELLMLVRVLLLFCIFNFSRC